MAPRTAQRLNELRETLDATFTVVHDDGCSIVVHVVPSDLPPFFLTIDPLRLRSDDDDAMLN